MLNLSMVYIDYLDSTHGLDWRQGCGRNHSERDEKSNDKWIGSKDEFCWTWRQNCNKEHEIAACYNW